ncbi:hypothetical protein [Streptomyces sp. NPDC048521]|uniref:hypothetical protein n=1 Tax=Streptomyces sp. NPDC048521 TaxID=3365566 RepID=UPI0037117ED4
MDTPAHSEWTTALATGGIARAVPFGGPDSRVVKCQARAPVVQGPPIRSGTSPGRREFDDRT